MFSIFGWYIGVTLGIWVVFHLLVLARVITFNDFRTFLITVPFWPLVVPVIILFFLERELEFLNKFEKLVSGE